MKDPTRISSLMVQVQDLWEALPDLEFADVIRLLDNEGVLGLSDEDIPAALTQLKRRYPRSFSAANAACVLDTSEWTVSLDSTTAVVRGPGAPAIWKYSKIVSATVGAPLHLVDEAGGHRRFGIVQGIRPLGHRSLELAELPRLERRRIRDRVFVVVLADGGKVILGRTAQHFEIGRRDTQIRELHWRSLPTTRLGTQLRIELSNGQGELDLGSAVAVYHVR